MRKKFASQADLEVKKLRVDKRSDNACSLTAEGEPNTGIVIGDDAVLVAHTHATPVMAHAAPIPASWRPTISCGSWRV